MTFEAYGIGVGYIGDVSAPTREAALEFLHQQGYTPGAFVLREVGVKKIYLVEFKAEFAPWPVIIDVEAVDRTEAEEKARAELLRRSPNLWGKPAHLYNIYIIEGATQ